MSIIRGARPSDNFAMIRNAALEDSRLSYRARGLLGYLLSRPPGWKTSAERLADSSPKEGRDAIRTALQELALAGYLSRSTSHNEKGYWNYDHYVSDVPVKNPEGASSDPLTQVSPPDTGVTTPPEQATMAEPDTGDGLSVVGSADVGESVLNNKKEDNKNEVNKNEEKQVLQDDTLVSPAMPTDFTDIPNWVPREPHWWDHHTKHYASRGIALIDAIRNYDRSGFNGEEPSASRFASGWYHFEFAHKDTGKPLPGQEGVTASNPVSLTEAFDMFWEAFPKKERRPVAFAAFKAAVLKVENPMVIINGAKGYSRKVRRDHLEEQYMKSPTNWLNDEQWLDKYPGALAPQSRTAADY